MSSISCTPTPARGTSPRRSKLSFITMLFALLLAEISREPRILAVDPHKDGDCFSEPCSIKTAAMAVRTADIVHFGPFLLNPSSYPSEFSDLMNQLTLMNTTVYSDGAVVDGTFLAGEMLFQVTSHPHYTWTRLVNWTFQHFSKPIWKREFTWSTAPYIVFTDCEFIDSASDLFVVKGGTYIFENCEFANIDGRVVKAVSGANFLFIDCSFSNCSSFFFHDSDATFRNCVFMDMHGDRGGAIHSSRSTLYVDGCAFINCSASVNGGALYVRESSNSTEITNNCFVSNRAAVNGTAIYAYASSITISANSFDTSDHLFTLASSVKETNTTINARCVHHPSGISLDRDFLPCDTFKLWELDTLEPDTVIEL